MGDVVAVGLSSLRAHAHSDSRFSTRPKSLAGTASPPPPLSPDLVAITLSSTWGSRPFRPSRRAPSLIRTSWRSRSRSPGRKPRCGRTRTTRASRASNTTAAHADDESTGVAALTVDEDDELTELVYLVYSAVTVFFWVFLINFMHAHLLDGGCGRRSPQCASFRVVEGVLLGASIPACSSSCMPSLHRSAAVVDPWLQPAGTAPSPLLAQPPLVPLVHPRASFMLPCAWSPASHDVLLAQIGKEDAGVPRHRGDGGAPCRAESPAWV